MQMLSIKKVAFCVMALLCMTVGASAAKPLEPQEVIKGQSEELKTIQKVYILPNTGAGGADIFLDCFMLLIQDYACTPPDSYSPAIV